MSTYRVPKCGRHFVKFDDVTIYPVLVVARTGLFDDVFRDVQNIKGERSVTNQSRKLKLITLTNPLIAHLLLREMFKWKLLSIWIC